MEPVTIGPCQLYLGDCRDILPSLSGVDAVVTDPPYGIGFVYQEGKEDTNTPEEYGRFLLPIIETCKGVANPGAFFAVWQAQKNYRHFWEWFGNEIRIYCAAKNFVQLRKTPINYGYDPVVMWYEPGEPLRPVAPSRNVDFYVGNTASIVSDPTRLERGHPCPRPLDAVRQVVANFTALDSLVVDPFLGSGTTGVACVKEGRRFIGIEKSPEYFEIAVKRIREAVRADRDSLWPAFPKEEAVAC